MTDDDLKEQIEREVSDPNRHKNMPVVLQAGKTNEIHGIFRADCDGTITVCGIPFKVVQRDTLVLLIPVDEGAAVAEPPTQALPIVKRDKESLRQWWLAELARRNIPLVTPDYSRLPATAGVTWAEESEEE